MRLLCVLTLVLVLPCTGVRLVCLDADADRNDTAAPRVAASQTAACEHACARHTRTASRPKCLFVADDDRCAFVLDGVTAVLQQQAPVLVAPPSSPLPALPSAVAYPAPVLSPPGPPPKV
jgi:hypothetical protein